MAGQSNADGPRSNVIGRKDQTGNEEEELTQVIIGTWNSRLDRMVESETLIKFKDMLDVDLNNHNVQGSDLSTGR